MIRRSMLLTLCLSACGAGGAGREAAPPDSSVVGQSTKEEATMPFTLESDAFAAGEPIPARFTCDGENVSPALRWSGAPQGARTFALVVDDPDAPRKTWVHWVAYDLPADAGGVPEGVAAGSRPGALGGGANGENDFGDLGYGGPCPPPGAPHHYHFRLSALDAPLGLDPGATKAEVEAAMQAHVVGRAELVGTYARR